MPLYLKKYIRVEFYSKNLSLNEAATQALLLGRETITLLMNDPLLPSPFVDEHARNQFAQNVQQLDSIGQKLWQKLYENELAH